MLICAISREQLLELLPSNARVAEIGVFEGEFSEKIWTQTKPQHLYLIDAWVNQDNTDYAFDDANGPQDEMNARYEKVKKSFAPQMAEGRVTLIREFSDKAASQIPDASLDWVYIDGNHTYQAVLQDLEIYSKKIKPDGLIVGDDYTNHYKAREMKFGVVEAVNEFVEKSDYRLLLMTGGYTPNFVLARAGAEQVIQRITSEIVYRVPGVVEIADFPKACSFEHRVMALKNGQGPVEVRFLPSIKAGL